MEKSNNLEIIPGPPKCLDGNVYIKSSLSHRLFITELTNSNINGTVIRSFNGLVDFFAQSNRDNEEFENLNRPDRESNPSLGCLFIPDSQNCCPFLIKTVFHKPSKEKTAVIESIGTSLIYQLTLFQCVLIKKCELTATEDLSLDLNKSIVPIIIIIWMQKQISKPESAKLITDLTNFINQQSENGKKFFKIEFEIKFSNPDDISAILENFDSGDYQMSSQNRIQKFINSLTEIEVNFADRSPDDSFYTLSNEPFRSFNNQKCTFQIVPAIVGIINSYFPKKREKLELVPNLDQIFDNILYATTDSGNLGSANKYGSYMGEVKDFCHCFLTKLPNSNGTFLKNFADAHFSTLLHERSCQPIRFEIDWIYCGDVIVAFEVGYAEDSEKPTTIIARKIEQALTKIVPQMEMIIHTFFTTCQKWNNETSRPINKDFQQFLQNSFKVIIFITNVKFATLRRTISSFKSALKTDNAYQKSAIYTQVVTPVRNCSGKSLNQLLFLAEDEKSRLGLFKIDQNFDIVDSGFEIREMFQQKPNHKNEVVEYINSLFTLASLNKIFSSEEYFSIETTNSLDIDRRYWNSFAEWSKMQNKNSTSPIGLQFILSPEQHRILSENKRFVGIFGEPGSGKTSLLLAQRSRFLFPSFLVSSI